MILEDLNRRVKKCSQDKSPRFTPCTLTGIELSSTLQKSYRDIYEQTGTRWYPHRCSHLAQHIVRCRENILQETETFINLKDFQKYLKTIDNRERVNIDIGEKVSIIQAIPHVHDNIIELQGFRTPKKIKNIFKDGNDDIEWIEFVDGSTFPDRHFIEAGKGGGELEGTSTLFFPSKHSADVATTAIVVGNSTGWQLSTNNLKQ